MQFLRKDYAKKTIVNAFSYFLGNLCVNYLYVINNVLYNSVIYRVND